MADWSSAELNPPKYNPTAPPGDVSYPDKIQSLILDYCEAQLADEVEIARELASSIVENLNENYATTPLTKNIDGSGVFKFTNMKDGSSTYDYYTLKQANTEFAPPTLTDLSTSSPLNKPYATLRVDDSDANPPDVFDVFRYTPEFSMNSSVSGNFYYPGTYNRTYYLNWDVSGITRIRLLSTPNLGDRVIIVTKNNSADEGIYSDLYKIHGDPNLITFGAAYLFTVYDLIYAGGATGWYFNNVILGAEI